MSADLSSLTIGALSLTPEFDSGVTAYAVSTSNATNKVTAVAADENATIQILNGETEIENGSSATWEVGENTLTVKVTNGSAEKVYTVTVTKS
jgi:hypothetical protein